MELFLENRWVNRIGHPSLYGGIEIESLHRHVNLVTGALFEDVVPTTIYHDKFAESSRTEPAACFDGMRIS